jgi:hypothetical protein
VAHDNAAQQKIVSIAGMFDATSIQHVVKGLQLAIMITFLVHSHILVVFARIFGKIVALHATFRAELGELSCWIS